MNWNHRTMAGFFVFVAAAQFLVGMLLAEALYPGYSISGNYISDLGATCTDTTCRVEEPAATVFNVSVFLLGALVVLAAYGLWRSSKRRILPLLMAVTGIGAMGVGIFTEAYPGVHLLVATIAFVFGGLAAIWSYTLTEPPLAYLSVALGALALLALVLFSSDVLFGLGVGGMERLIVYPEILWAMAFGGYLMHPEAGQGPAPSAAPPS